MSCRPRATLAGWLLVALASCTRDAPPSTPLGLLPFENLSGDATLDWLSAGVPRALAEQLSGSGGERLITVRTLRDARTAGVGRVLHGYFSSADGRLRLSGVLEDLARVKTIRSIVVEGTRADMLPLLDQLARQISSRAQPYGTRSADAFEQFERGVQADRANAATVSLRAATQSDPAFGPAWLALAQRLAADGDSGGARATLERARGVVGTDRDRARIDLLDATIAGDPMARLDALSRAAKLTPQDPAAWTAFADAAVAARRYAMAIDGYRRAISLEPANGLLSNSLGYAHAYNGDLAAALAAFEQYARAAPQDANPLDSLGEASYLLGRFDQAEKYFVQAQRKDALGAAGESQAKAAYARLMTGDREGAGALYRAHDEARRKSGDSLAEFRLAQWEYWSVSGERAAARLEKFRAGTSGDVAALAAAQLAAWSLERGDRAGARVRSAEAMKTAQNPLVRFLAALCAFLAQPDAAAGEWMARAARSFPGAPAAGLRARAAGYALALSRRFPEAVAPWREAYERSHPASDGDVRVLLAWTLIESGRFEEARPLLALTPLPARVDTPGLVWLTFPRIFDLRARLAESLKNTEEAKRQRALFVKLGGE